MVPNEVRLSDAMTPSPQLRPAISAILTGKPPVEIGVRNDVTTPLPETRAARHRRAESERAGARPRSSPTRAWGSGAGWSAGSRCSIRPRRFSSARFAGSRACEPPREVVRDFSKWVATLPEGASFFAWIQISRPRRSGSSSRARESVQDAGDDAPPDGSLGRARRHGGQDRSGRRRAQRLSS